MRNKFLFIAVCMASISLLDFTACSVIGETNRPASQAGAGSSPITDNDSETHLSKTAEATEGVHTEEESYAESQAGSTDTVESLELSDETREIGRFIYEYQTRIDLYNTTLKANGKEYECSVYMYHVDNETAGTLYGQIVAELYLDGRLLDREHLINTTGSRGPEFSKDDLGEYFSTLNMSEDVLMYAVPDIFEDYIGTVFYKVNEEERFEMIVRYHDEDEGDDFYAAPKHRPLIMAGWFKLTDSYDIDGDRIIYHFDDRDVPMYFDFGEESTLVCENEEDMTRVYTYY